MTGSNGPVRPASAATPSGGMAVSTESIKAENGQSTVEPEGGEVLGIPSIGETLGGLAAPLAHGQAVTREAVRLGGELARVAVGRSELAPAKGDRRFSDPAWSGNPLFNRIQRGYLAAAGALTKVVEDYAEGTDDARRAEQARFASNILISTLAPTNYLPTNPAALKRAFDTGGAQPGARARALRRRPAEQRRDAEDGRPGRVRGGSQPRAQPRCGRRSATRWARCCSTSRPPSRCPRGRCSSSRRRSTASTSSTSARAAASSSTP